MSDLGSMTRGSQRRSRNADPDVEMRDRGAPVKNATTIALGRHGSCLAASRSARTVSEATQVADLNISAVHQQALLGVLHEIRAELWRLEKSDDLDRVVGSSKVC